MSKSIVVYYSRADENYVCGQLKYLDVGNTEKVAIQLSKLLGCELFKIEQKEPYSKSYNVCIDQAHYDQKNHIYPELKEDIDLYEYEDIYLGYPNYWGTMPMAVFTFLKNHDFKNKIIHPFCTHEGSGLGHSVQDLKDLGLDVDRGLDIVGSKVDDCKEQLKEWL